MEKINEIFENELVKTVDAFPSIFTKDDVVKILTELRTNVLNATSDVLSETNNKTTYMTKSKFEDFSSCVARELEKSLRDNDFRFIDYESAEFELDHSNRVSLQHIEFDSSSIEEELYSILLSELQEHFGELIVESKEE